MSYTKTAKALHWLMAALLFGLLGIGFYMHDLPLSPEKLQLYSWHKWAGVTAFLLVAFRLFWRLAHRPPALPASMPKRMQFAAHAGHLLLYVLMIAIPLSGWTWVYSTAWAEKVVARARAKRIFFMSVLRWGVSAWAASGSGCRPCR